MSDRDALMLQDETARQAFVILSGKAVVKRNGRKVAEPGPGDSVGEHAVYPFLWQSFDDG